MPLSTWLYTLSHGTALWLHQVESKTRGKQCLSSSYHPQLQPAVDKHIFHVWSFCVEWVSSEIHLVLQTSLRPTSLLAWTPIVMSSCHSLFSWWFLGLTSRRQWTHTPTNTHATIANKTHTTFQFSFVFFASICSCYWNFHELVCSFRFQFSTKVNMYSHSAHICTYLHIQKVVWMRECMFDVCMHTYLWVFVFVLHICKYVYLNCLSIYQQCK